MERAPGKNQRNRAGLILLGVGLALCLAFACAMPVRKVELQGISGKFTTYRLPVPENCADKYTTQEDLDFCKHRNSQRIVEPLRGTITIKSLDTFERLTVTLDSLGGYRKELQPGYYSVCLGLSCSDALEVRMQQFETFGAQYPFAAVDSIRSSASDSAAQAK